MATRKLRQSRRTSSRPRLSSTQPPAAQAEFSATRREYRRLYDLFRGEPPATPQSVQVRLHVLVRAARSAARSSSPERDTPLDFRALRLNPSAVRETLDARYPPRRRHYSANRTRRTGGLGRNSRTVLQPRTDSSCGTP